MKRDYRLRGGTADYSVTMEGVGSEGGAGRGSNVDFVQITVKLDVNSDPTNELITAYPIASIVP